MGGWGRVHWGRGRHFKNFAREKAMPILHGSGNCKLQSEMNKTGLLNCNDKQN